MVEVVSGFPVVEDFVTVLNWRRERCYDVGSYEDVERNIVAELRRRLGTAQLSDNLFARLNVQPDLIFPRACDILLPVGTASVRSGRHGQVPYILAIHRNACSSPCGNGCAIRLTLGRLLGRTIPKLLYP